MKVRRLLAPSVLFIGLVQPVVGHAQGCSQCLDNTAASSPATQRAYGHAIELMIGAAATVFLATWFVIRRQP